MFERWDATRPSQEEIEERRSRFVDVDDVDTNCERLLVNASRKFSQRIRKIVDVSGVNNGRQGVVDAASIDHLSVGGFDSNADLKVILPTRWSDNLTVPAFFQFPAETAESEYVGSDPDRLEIVDTPYGRKPSGYLLAPDGSVHHVDSILLFNSEGQSLKYTAVSRCDFMNARDLVRVYLISGSGRIGKTHDEISNLETSEVEQAIKEIGRTIDFIPSAIECFEPLKPEDVEKAEAILLRMESELTGC